MWLKVELPTTNWPFRLSLESFLLLESSFKEVSLYCFTFLAREKFLWLKIDLFPYKTDCDTVWDQKKVIGRFWNLPWGISHCWALYSFYYLGHIDIFLSRKNLMIIESFSSCFRVKILRKDKTGILLQFAFVASLIFINQSTKF